MAGFDEKWEIAHREKEWGKYPPEELIRTVMRRFKKYARAERSALKFLELGCGTGANIWFFCREGFDATGVDGSPTAIAKASAYIKEQFGSNCTRLICNNFMDLEFAPASFDAIIDIASLQHNTMSDVNELIARSHKWLKPEGLYFGMMVAKGTIGDGTGVVIEPGTFTDIPDGPYSGLGKVHFFDMDEIRLLFDDFSQVDIDYSIRTLNNMKFIVKHWLVTAQK